RVQGTHGRVAADGAEGGHPQVAAHQVVAAPAHDVAAWATGLAIAVHAAGRLDRQHAEIGDQLSGRGKAVDVQDKGGEHSGGNHPNAGNSIEVIGLGKGAVGGPEQVFQAFLPSAGVAELADLVAHQLGGGGPVEGGDGRAGVLQQRGDLGVGQVG